MSDLEHYHPTEHVDPCDHEAINALKLTVALVIGMLLGATAAVAVIDARSSLHEIHAEAAS